MKDWKKVPRKQARQIDEKWNELKAFDWDTDKLKPPPQPTPDEYLTVHDAAREHPKGEPAKERVRRMLCQLRRTTLACSMCHLGRRLHQRDHYLFDPHVFHGGQPARWVVVGQNPGLDECLQHEPFVGPSGKFFNEQIERHGLSRNNFYITNAVKCCTRDNATPSAENIARCAPILQMELTILNPILVITLGAIALKVLCPGARLDTDLGRIIESERFGVKVFSTYHPSPRNMVIESRKQAFVRNIRTICRIYRAMASEDQ